MAQDYNLGRVQGKGLWIADATFTSSGIITLGSGFTIQPLTQDYVIDKETNNVYAIATISGSNPFNFTTNGTPIFTLGGGGKEKVIQTIEFTENNISSKVSEFATLKTNMLNNRFDTGNYNFILRGYFLAKTSVSSYPAGLIYAPLIGVYYDSTPGSTYGQIFGFGGRSGTLQGGNGELEGNVYYYRKNGYDVVGMSHQSTYSVVYGKIELIDLGNSNNILTLYLNTTGRDIIDKKELDTIFENNYNLIIDDNYTTDFIKESDNIYKCCYYDYFLNEDDEKILNKKINYVIDTNTNTISYTEEEVN